MQQYSLSLDADTLNAGVLLVREEGGAVRAASRKEISTVARELVNGLTSMNCMGRVCPSPDWSKTFYECG